jgi:hypothetical protein
MAKIPNLAKTIVDTNFKGLRQSVIDNYQAGKSMEDITETILAEAEARIDAGDLIGADAILYHAVHAGIRPSMLFTECRKAYNP